MKREDFITKLAELYDSIPDHASSYHICDVLIYKAERMGMLPPPDENTTHFSGEEPGGYSPNQWTGESEFESEWDNLDWCLDNPDDRWEDDKE